MFRVGTSILQKPKFTEAWGRELVFITISALPGNLLNIAIVSISHSSKGAAIMINNYSKYVDFKQTDLRVFSNFVKTMRLYAGMTQHSFAATLLMPQRTLQNWEAGTRQPPEYMREWFWCAVKCRMPLIAASFVHDLQLEGFLYE